MASKLPSYVLQLGNVLNHLPTFPPEVIVIIVISFHKKERCVQETLKEIIGIIFEILITNKLDNHLSLRLKILLLWVVIPVCGKSPVIILVLKIKLLDKSTKIKR
ncbi:unnamed protein product [Rhizophagus irregularis]|uniref:Uncharacterized protein n=1 Tax=Rhizophagus irregularis TaxID=588596 RepID=A0A916DWP2_9GLOM|nr:unnamed protein product [Rhizophagus irregularis]CAB5298066.1 unnamed protein product [Rhizophagus irregularis]